MVSADKGWQETAKRLAAHPRFKWLGGMKVWPAGSSLMWVRLVIPPFEFTEGDGTIPDLTDWPTVGVLLGMVVEASKESESDLTVETCSTNTGHMDWAPWRVSLWEEIPWVEGETQLNDWLTCGGATPGQALAELLLELWGDHAP